IITVVDPTTAAIQIAEDVKNLISRINAGESPATEHLESPELIEEAKRIYREARIKESFVVLNRVKNQKMEDYLTKKIEEKGLTVIGVVYDDSSIALAWLQGKPLKKIKANQEAKDILKRLEQKVKENN
ncbi:MAG: hypothetical protein ACOC6G_02185, partial [Thermoproteota archaeon]